MGHPPAQLWQSIIEFYERLNRKGWKLGPMLELVTRLSASPWAAVLYPSQSHHALGLSRVESYEDRLKTPMVYVEYDWDAGVFRVQFQRCAGQGDHSKQYADDLGPAAWDEIASWLGIPLPSTRRA